MGFVHVAAALSLTAACAQTTVDVQWSSVVRPLKTVAAHQTVVNALTTQQSPIHDAVYNAIATLGADYQRFVPWLPYPKLGIAELEPPSTGVLCGFVNSGGPGQIWNATIDCGRRGLGVIASITFASYGTPHGYCGNLTADPKCDAPGVQAKAAAACVGQASCTLSSNDETWGASPCVGSRFAVEATCSAAKPSQVYTYWDFSYLDQSMLDFMAAAGSGERSTIPNFSTIPAWLFTRGDRQLYPDDPLGETWSYESGGNTFRDPTLREVGDYYGRMLAYYTEGGFTDEAGTFVPGHKLNISHWEVLNEIEGEHAMSPQTYTAVYDAIVAGIKRWAPTGSSGMRFMGLALEADGINYVSYFLNASNHAPGTPLDAISFHRYASPSARDGGDSNGSAYTSGMFPNVDSWVNDYVMPFIATRDALSPGTLLDADEVGVILPDDNDAVWTSAAPGFPNTYWNAAGAMYAYAYGKVSVVGLDILGESQMVGYPSFNFTRPEPVGLWLAPPQYPSVALLNWTDGSGTARYWVLKLLIDEMVPGAPAGRAAPSAADAVVNTTTSIAPGPAAAYFCGSVINLDTLSLACDDPSATINAVTFASYGTPTGTCGAYAVGTCNAANSTAIVESYCLGKNSCSVPATTPVFGDPCYMTVKNLVVQATCSSGGGHQEGLPAPVYAQAYVEAAGSGARKVLVVNTLGTSQQVTLAGAAGGVWRYVDPSTAFGPPAQTTLPAGSDTWTIGPFGVGVLRLQA